MTTTAEQSFSTAALVERTIYRRAVEVAIWGMPAVSMASIRASLKRDLGADYGDVIYFSNVMEPRHEFLTANNQTPYVFVFFDLRHGPMALTVPPATDKTALFGSAIDSWEVPLIDVGPTGEDAGLGGKYLFLPPGYEGAIPRGYLPVSSPTMFVHIALRPIATGSGALEDAVAYSQTLKTYALDQAANPPPSRYIDAYPRAWKTLPLYDLTYFRLLSETLDIEPPQVKDAAMLGMLASIGIEKGKRFHPDSATAEVLANAIQEASIFLNEYFVHGLCERFWPDRQWLSVGLEDIHGFSYYGDGELDYDRRAATFYFATWAPKRVRDPSTLPASHYLCDFRDSSGSLYSGSKTYRVRVPADTPARDFWSIIAYEVGTNAFIYNAQNRVGVSSYDKDQLALNGDGSVDVYIGPKPLEGRERNWIPTAGKNFWLMARFYGPEPRLFDRTWVMPDVEKAS